MSINITPTTNHREREKGFLVYPVYSRRAKGLSIGINLFPDQKRCTFNCPYCEVFPFFSGTVFSPDQMEEELRGAISAADERSIPVKDICFSGNGEPTLSPVFPEALKIAESIRSETASAAELVVITNSTGLLHQQVFSLLKDAAVNPSLNIWLKLDAGTPGWYQKMNRCDIPHQDLIAKIKEFTACAPVTIQTMLCAIDGSPPPDNETKTRETLMSELAAAGKIRKVQLYGKARAAPEDPLASQLPEDFLEQRAASLRGIFAELGVAIPVEVYL